MKKQIYAICAATTVLFSCGGGSLSGTYECEGLYKTLDFRSGGNVVVKAMGFEFPTTYKINGGYLYVAHDKGGNLSFKIQDKDILIGEGYAKGTCKKKI